MDTKIKLSAIIKLQEEITQKLDTSSTQEGYQKLGILNFMAEIMKLSMIEGEAV